MWFHLVTVLGDCLEMTEVLTSCIYQWRILQIWCTVGSKCDCVIVFVDCSIHSGSITLKLCGEYNSNVAH
jgi:hypothetical protein